MSEVYMKFIDENGQEVEKLNPKIFIMNDSLFDQCKKAYKNSQKKLISVRYVDNDTQTNPEWIKYNSIFNEGEEGYNPHAQWINVGKIEKTWKV